MADDNNAIVAQQIRDDVNSLKGYREVIQRDIGNLDKNIGILAGKIEARAETNWGTIVGFGGLIFAVISASWIIINLNTSAALSPVIGSTELNKENVRHLSDSVHTIESLTANSTQADAISKTDREQTNARLRAVEIELSKEIADRRTGAASQREAVIEIETQLRSVCNQENLRFAHQERMNSVLWDKAFDGPRYPVANFFPPPCISANGALVGQTQ